MFRWMLDGSHNEDAHGNDGIWTWVSLLCAAVFIFLICWLFHQLCYPPPNMFEQTVFYVIILFIFLETVYAGWYRSEE